MPTWCAVVSFNSGERKSESGVLLCDVCVSLCGIREALCSLLQPRTASYSLLQHELMPRRNMLCCLRHSMTVTESHLGTKFTNRYFLLPSFIFHPSILPPSSFLLPPSILPPSSLVMDPTSRTRTIGGSPVSTAPSNSCLNPPSTFEISTSTPPSSITHLPSTVTLDP